MKLQRTTRRLAIRPYRSTDFDAWHEANSKSLPPQNLWDKVATSRDGFSKREFRKVLQTQAANRRKESSYHLGIFLKNGALVGGVSLMDLTRGVFQNAILGYRIFNRFWGKGYGPEAVRAGIDIAFRDLRLHRLEAGIEPRNTRSIRLAKRLGFRKEGLSKRRIFLRKQWVDLLLYVLTTEDAGYRWKGKARLPGRRY